MKVLFVAGHEFIEKQDNGGRQCSYRNYIALQRIFGPEQVYLCLLSNTTQSSEINNIKVFPTHKNKWRQIYNTIFFRNGYSKKTRKEITRYINSLNADIIWFDFSITGALVKDIIGNPQIVVFLHNVERRYMWNRVTHGGIQYLLPYFSYAYNEKCIVNKADKVICLNERDACELERCYGVSAQFLMPMTFDDRYNSLEAKEIKKLKKNTNEDLQLLFVGSLFAPNYDGIHWFVKNVMPHLKRCRLTIIGKDMETKSEELNGTAVDVIGTVDDISSYYYQADAVVIPILYGDGMKIKTAEAMMFGKPILATTEALEGYQVANTKGIWRCNSVNEFCHSVEELRDYIIKNKIAMMEESIRELFLEKYVTNTVIEQLDCFLKES